MVVQFLPGVGTALPSPARESSRELLFGVVDKRSIGYLLLLFGGRGGDVRFDIVFADVHVAMGGFPMRPGVLSMKLVLDTAEDDIEWIAKAQIISTLTFGHGNARTAGASRWRISFVSF